MGPTPRDGQPAGHTLAQRPLLVVCFLLLAASTQLLLAMYGLLSRYVQVKPSPPVPALRLVLLANLIGEAAMVAFHLAPALLLRAWQRRRAVFKEKQQPELPLCDSQGTAGSGDSAGKAPNNKHSSSIEAGATDAADELSSRSSLEASAAEQRPPPPAIAASTLRAPVPLMRGMTFRLERWQQRRPVLHRRLALAAIVLSFTGCCSLQILAPGFVDVSIVQLTTQWTTLAIALTQALLLRHRLPLPFWPCAAAMLAGACMVIVPSVGQSTVGSLNTLRGWMGFVMALAALFSTVIYYCLLQATRHLGFRPLQLQHLMNLFSILLFLCLSLPVDGPSWAGQFAGWAAADWLALVGLSTVAYLGSGMCMQVCVFKLGAPTAAMFFGLRLVFAVALSHPILGASAIQTGVQIAGVAVTTVAVTCYAASQWWASRQAQLVREREQRQAGEQEQAEQCRSVQLGTVGGRDTPPGPAVERVLLRFV